MEWGGPRDAYIFLKTLNMFSDIYANWNLKNWRDSWNRKDVKVTRNRTLMCLTPQLTSLLGWYKSHEMSNICRGEEKHMKHLKSRLLMINFASKGWSQQRRVRASSAGDVILKCVGWVREHNGRLYFIFLRFLFISRAPSQKGSQKLTINQA